MNVKEISEIISAFLEILLSWPVILLLIMLLLRHQIRELIPSLASRLRKASVAGSTFEFSNTAVRAFQDAIESGAEEYKGDTEQLLAFVRELVKKVREPRAVAQEVETPLSGRSILWVDDRPMNNVYESSFLRRLGASIMFARSTAEAMAFLNQGSYDLIISDVHRVENGSSNPTAGYQLLEELKNRKVRIPLIFYTGSVARMDHLRARSAYGAADVPSDVIDLAVRALRS